MTSNKRERELARAKYERQQARRNDKAARAKRTNKIVAIVVVAALVIGFGGWVILARVLGGSDASASAAPAASPATTLAAASAEPTGEDALTCGAPGTARKDDMTFAAAPTDKATTAGIALETNCGDIIIEPVADKAPKTVASEQFLTSKGFYDNTSCHRVTTEGIYVLQCGDPAGNGTGGPGYTVPDENLPSTGDNNYPAGTVAMANAGPGTAGSQFFIVYKDTTLPAGYTVWGHVVDGLGIVEQVAEKGVEGGGADGTPAQPVFIQAARLTTP